MENHILPLSSQNLTLQQAGGKGANLSRVTHFGFPVPPGFIITTGVYLQFCELHHLSERIAAFLGEIDPSSPPSFEVASAKIRSLFDQHAIHESISIQICSAYQSIGSPAVAVRSSATAEDLPGTSFAGQQDTFLNIVGEPALLASVKLCWSSLWTARAISYRMHHQISQDGLSIAVVVQQMVQSDVSGVAFTANPLNGIRSQTVINATVGLGEALVSGKVEADQYVVDCEQMKIISQSIGQKAISIRSSAGGGTFTQTEVATSSRALDDEQILSLASLCQQIASHFEGPQDIEWAFSNGEILILQSRPITSLFPLPKGVTARPLRVFGSFAAVQGVVNPITPLGQQTLLIAFVGGARTFGYHLTLEDQKTFNIAGERIWSDITSIIRNSVGQKLAPSILSFVEPTLRQAVLKVIEDPRLKPDREGIRFSTRIRLARFLLPAVGNVLLNMLFTTRRRESSNRWVEGLIRGEIEKNLTTTGSRDEKLSIRIKNLESVAEMVQRIFPRLVSLVATGMANLNFTVRLINSIKTSSSEEKSENSLLYLELTRGLPHNVTTEMDMALWQTAQAIKSDPASFSVFSEYTPEQFMSAYSGKSFPTPGQAAVEKFMSQYEMRGVGEIDIGRERWKENPLQVFQTLQSYLKIDDPSKAPDVIFARGENASTAAQETILNKLGQQKHGWLKKQVARKVMRTYRAFGGLRETPKFTIIRLMGAIRIGLLESGEEYVRDGIINQPGDLFYLRVDELKQLASGVSRNWKRIISERRAIDEHEKNRRQIPRLFLSDGEAFYEGIISAESNGEDNLIGAPVSPGLVEGVARIVVDPQKTTLLPGEILVCPGTDPAWTPLFLAAGGLVMEVGGLMTHGAVVAREYGIPAVVGVHQATLRIKTGQRIRVNGTNGQVQILC